MHVGVAALISDSSTSSRSEPAQGKLGLLRDGIVLPGEEIAPRGRDDGCAGDRRDQSHEDERNHDLDEGEARLVSHASFSRNPIV